MLCARKNEKQKHLCDAFQDTFADSVHYPTDPNILGGYARAPPRIVAGEKPSDSARNFWDLLLQHIDLAD